VAKLHQNHLHQYHLLTYTAYTSTSEYFKMTCCHTYRPQPSKMIEHVMLMMICIILLEFGLMVIQ